MSYIGNTVENQNYVPAIDYFNGDGSTVAFTLSRPVASVAAVQAVISNVPQNPGSAFTVSGSTITFTSAPPSGTANIYVYYTSPNTQVVQPGQGTVYPSSLSTGGPTWNTSGSLGLGVTPSAWGDYPGVVQMTGGALAGYTGGNYLEVIQNGYYSGSSYYYVNTGYASKYQQYQGQHQWWTASSGTAGDALTFTRTLVVGKGTTLALEGASSVAGTGITFPAAQSASSDANTLDDYEEGYVDLTLAFGGSSTGITYGGRRFHYVKIGQQVTITGDLYIQNKGSATGGATITGLPFTIANGNEYYSSPTLCYITSMTYTGVLNGYGVLNNTYISLAVNNNGSTAAANNTHFTNSSEILFTFTYFTT